MRRPFSTARSRESAANPVRFFSCASLSFCANDLSARVSQEIERRSGGDGLLTFQGGLGGHVSAPSGGPGRAGACESGRRCCGRSTHLLSLLGGTARCYVVCFGRGALLLRPRPPPPSHYALGGARRGGGGSERRPGCPKGASAWASDGGGRWLFGAPAEPVHWCGCAAAAGPPVGADRSGAMFGLVKDWADAAQGVIRLSHLSSDVVLRPPNWAVFLTDTVFAGNG